MSSDIAIKVENLSKCYEIYEQPRDRLKQFLLPKLQTALGLQQKQYFKEFWALRDVTFEVKKGEVIGVVGANGSGKSTLLQLICGTLNQTNGKIGVIGRIAALLELGSGFNPDFTGRENIYFNGAILGFSQSEINERMQSILDFADIGDFIDQSVRNYSSGMVVRLAFAVAINADPEILIVDEALSVGDELFQRKCFAKIESIRRNGSTILFVSHSGSQIIQLCDRAILMDMGQNILIDTPKVVIENYQKLLYTPKSERSLIREKMMNENFNCAPAPHELSLGHSKNIEESTSLPQGEETYDTLLVPSSTIEYESNGAVISDVILVTMGGRKINGLVRGGRYCCKFKVTFNNFASSVRFGMSIKTTTGLMIAGAFSASSLNSAIEIIDAGTVVDVEFLFDCRLNPGMYYINTGVFGLEEDEEIILHRFTDILAFRVLSLNENIETEIMNLDFTPAIRFHDNFIP